MKKILLLICLLSAAKSGWSQYKPVDEGSSVKFTIKNLGFEVNGSFTGIEGIVNFDTQNAASCTFDVTINAATINTDNSLRDGHLKDDGFFDVKTYPRIRLTSTKITQAGKTGNYLFNGLLTIKGKSKPLSFPFTAMPQGDGYVYKATFKINRKDFGVGGTSTVADELQVMLNVLTKKM